MRTGRRGQGVLTIELLRMLRSEPGCELLRRAAALRDDPFAALRLREAEPGLAPDLAAAAVEQVRLRQRGAAKFAAADRMWFTASLLEQSSGEQVSRHRARRYRNFAAAGDFCSGLGGDTVALAGHTLVLAVDRDPLSLALTQANAEAWGVGDRVECRQADLPGGAPEVSAAWIDPGRREALAGGGTRRTRQLEEMSPAFSEVLELRRRVKLLGIKLSPATQHRELDAALGDLPHEREFLSVGGECRELALWIEAGAEPVGPGEASPLGRGYRRATVLPAGAALTGYPTPLAGVRPLGEWLLEPDPAVLRAGLVGNLAEQLGAWPIDAELAYLTAERPLETPFGTLYRVQGAEPFQGKALAERLRRLGAGDVAIKTRGSAVQPEILRRQLRGVLKQGRPQCRPVVFVTRLAGRAMMILGERFGSAAE